MVTTLETGSQATESRHPTRWGFAALLGIVGALPVGVIVLALVWPAATSQAQNLPVGIAGPDAAISTLEGVLAEQDPSPFALDAVDSREDAVDRIRHRELYGAILLGDEPEVLVAAAASPVAAQALRSFATQLQAQIDGAVTDALKEAMTGVVQALQAGQAPRLPPGTESAGEAPTVVVTDIVPLAEGDRTGAGLGASVFPVVLGGMLGGVLLALLVQGAGRRLVGLAVFGAAAGVIILLVMQTWFGMLHGSWLLNTTVVAVGVVGTASLIVGLAALLGPRGIALAAVITVLVANPIAGAAAPPQFLPEPWGEVGQWFVPGASATLLRSVAYFPDASTVAQWLVLAAWIVGGVVLTLVGHRRERAEIAPPVHSLES